MDLPNLFSSGIKTKAEELVLFLIISDAKLQVCLLELSREGVAVVSKSQVFAYEGLDTCVSQTDMALQQLDKRSDKISEIIFAVNSSWVKSGEVIDEKKPFIKKLTDELSLQPLGFIDINESIAQQKMSENSLFSGMIILLTQSEILFTLVYQGKIKKTEIVGSSTSFESDFTEGVARVQKSVEKQGNYLPSKLVLASFELSDVQLHEYQQKVYEQDWEANKTFLQTPTVEVITQDKLLLDLSREAGRDAAAHKGLTDFALAASVGGVKGNTVGTLDSEEFGFSDPLEEPPTSFGIPITSQKPELAIDDAELDNVAAVPDDFLHETSSEEKAEIVLDKKDKSKRDWAHKKNLKWFIVAGVVLGVVTLFAGLFLGAPLIAQTEVEVTVNKKLVSKDIELTLDTQATTTDVEKLLIAADTVTKKVADTSTMQTTGIKIVGEQAKGKIIVYNKTQELKTFDRGTQLKSGNLVFTLDEPITVASASAKQGGEDYGKQEAIVTATDIGAEGNLTKDTELSIASYASSSYNAFVTDGLTGGSSREVRVVAQKDLDELLKDLREELLKKVNEEFAAESGNGKYILPSKSIISEKATYDTELEKEAESLSLDLEIEVEAVTYSGGDLKPVAQEILSKELPENYELEDVDPQILSSPSQTDLDALESEAVVSIDANISAYAIPKLSEDAIKAEIVGKSFTEATELLTAKDEIATVSFQTIPSMLGSFVTKVSTATGRIVVRFNK